VKSGHFFFWEALSMGKPCNQCGEPIKFEKLATGRWRPVELDGGRHSCGLRSSMPAARLPYRDDAEFASLILAGPPDESEIV
jgi:hypothetical protein